MKTKVLIIILAFISTFTFAQRNVADKFFKKYSYIKAIELYKEALKNGDDSEHVLTRLGDCYYNNSNSEKAANWYHKALQKYPKINPEYIYKYIQTQRSLGNYEETKTWLAKFNEVQSRDSHNNSIVSDLSIYDELSSTDRVCVDIKNLDLNTPYSDTVGKSFSRTSWKITFVKFINTKKRSPFLVRFLDEQKMNAKYIRLLVHRLPHFNSNQ
tara:strand:+ start:503 stop:1141 length:639 start_codon:yes stop_codon:yes gene_type:complete